MKFLLFLGIILSVTAAPAQNAEGAGSSRRVVEWGSYSTPKGPIPVQPMPAGLEKAGVLSGKNVVAVSSGHFHSLAVCSDGTVAAWGENTEGQLGDGSTKRSLVPVAVDQRGVLSGKTVIAVIAGGYGNKGFKSYSLALCSDGTLAAWGANDSGQMGNGTLKSSLVPVAVNQSGALSGRTVVSIAAGGYRNLVLCSDGTMAVWGSAGGGGFSSPVPVAIKPIGALAGKTVIAVAVGFDHCLALCSDGTVVAWGGTFWQGNVYPGVLGNNTSAGSLVPVAVNTQGVLSGRKVVAVAAGASHSLALCSDGTLVAWGDNFHGQLGNNGGRPLAAPGKQKVRKTVKGTPANAYIPVLVDQTGVLAGKTIIAMTAARHHSLVLCSDGTMAAWGGNYGGSLGDNTTESSLVPIAVSKAALANGERFVGISTGTSLVYSYNLAIVASSSDSN